MRSMNILIAEDDDQNQAMMKLMLVRQGHTVQSAWNGRAAVEAVKNSHFDLVFMDIQMPEMDGLEATREIRRWENNQRHVPIVILTGSIPEKIKVEYKNAGADTFLLKPFDVKRIAMLVEIFEGEPDSGLQMVSQSKAEVKTPELPLLDMDESLLRFNNDKNFYLENLREFIQSLPGRLEKINHSLEERKWHDLATFAHNLKGVSANFGARQLSALASRLDDYSDHEYLDLVIKTTQDISTNIARLTERANDLFIEQDSLTSNHSGDQ